MFRERKLPKLRGRPRGAQDINVTDWLRTSLKYDCDFMVSKTW